MYSFIIRRYKNVEKSAIILTDNLSFGLFTQLSKARSNAQGVRVKTVIFQVKHLCFFHMLCIFTHQNIVLILQIPLLEQKHEILSAKKWG